ncbi:MAG: excinuclease ABC subunit UvrC [Nitrospiraceae bacterium]|nr:excinuclease ABC subunit UvrC [Nitrospiraceae bacterium]
MPEIDLKVKLSRVPRQQGVYIFRDEKDKVLYVGKAKSLRDRLRSYFQRGAALDERKQGMVRRVRDFSYIVTDSELEAFALEANLIKEHRPPFNVIFRDDKNYPYLKLTVNEEWPRLEVTRRILSDGALYYGPFVPAGAMWETLAFIRRHFNIRPCRYRLDKKMRPCIQRQMGRCPAPCDGSISKEQYAKAVEEVRLFLEGDKKKLLKELEGTMYRLAAEQLYEDAARLRDRIEALKRALEQQKVISPELGDIDVIGHASEDGMAPQAVQVFFIRKGLMIGSKDFYLPNQAPMPLEEFLAGFLEQFYSKEIIPPDEVLLRKKPQDAASIEAWLSARRRGKVIIRVPARGKKNDLLKMAERNAAELIRARKAAPGEKTLESLKERFYLRKAPESIGAFDISTTFGAQPVGGFIYWAGGEFRKEFYRHVKIKSVPAGKMDDYRMMEETVSRVLADLGADRPELVVIDGGKGQLEAAMRAVYTLPEPPPAGVIAVAKDPDRVFTTASELPVNIEDGSPSSLLLRRMRDEVHRFAIGFHKRLRGKNLLSSPLESVKGIGRQRRLALLKRFGSLEAIREAKAEEISRVEGIGMELAQVIKSTLDKKENVLE